MIYVITFISILLIADMVSDYRCYKRKKTHNERGGLWTMTKR